jgi:alcohol dehydrogenase YqhD (iron-dependent ADH family)
MKFEFHNPTHLIFGAGTLPQLGEAVRKHGKKAPFFSTDLVILFC